MNDDKHNVKSNWQWFLVHHCTGGKFHVVMNRVTRYQNTSLNENLIKSPDHIENVFGVSLRFRQFKVVFMVDIKSMYLQSQVNAEDQQSLKFQ